MIYKMRLYKTILYLFSLSDLQMPSNFQALSIRVTIYSFFSALLNSTVRSFKCSVE